MYPVSLEPSIDHPSSSLKSIISFSPLISEVIIVKSKSSFVPLFNTNKSFIEISILSSSPFAAFISLSPVIPFKSPKSDKPNVVSTSSKVTVGSLIRPVVKNHL